MIERDSKTGDFADVVASTSRSCLGNFGFRELLVYLDWVSTVNGGDSHARSEEQAATDAIQKLMTTKMFHFRPRRSIF